jgi:hypothetical protein
MKLVAFLFVLSTLSCVARLGETISESTTRYGSPLSTISKGDNCEEITFSKSGMVLTGKFFKGVCVELIIEKKSCISSSGEPPTFSDVQRLDEAEVKELLDQNAQGREWGDGPPTLSANEKSAYYHRDDGAMAVWRFDAGVTISSSVPTPYDAELEKESNSRAAQAAGKEMQGL